MLEVRDLHVFYGGIHALRGVSLKVEPGEIVTIIGANGAGKSTLLNAISAVVKRRSGTITLDGQPVASVPHAVVKQGICQVPEGRLVFANLTVRDNLMMGAYLRSDRAAIASDLEKVYTLFPRLKERINQLAGTLSGGEQQMLTIGRGLMSAPRIMLMDEPSLGLAPILVETIYEVIAEIRRRGTTILLVEQNAYKALAVADRAYVLEQGCITREGVAADLLHDEYIRQAYLGVKREKAGAGGRCGVE
ncbi:MAG: ABC transporter ATP-binding protein [Bacillota bacterium]|jgi:branched-chain amino acid transport system ATP-binding protein|nr:ABC transporter ATP-binding protein [Bacillota bacterium]